MGGSTSAARRVDRRVCALVVVAVVTACTIAACGGSSTSQSGNKSAQAVASYYTGWPTQGTPKHGGALTVDVGAPINSFYPARYTAGLQAMLAVNTSLFEFVPRTGNQKPVLKGILVSTWTLSMNRKVLTLNLRSGLQFSNGEPMTAEDVAHSLNVPDRFGLNGTAFVHATAVGNLTVQIQLSKPEQVFPETLSDTAAFPILPKKVLEREGEVKFGQHPVGMGPFMLKSASSGNAVLTFVRNPYYTHIQEGQPYLDTLVLNTVESDSARILGVRSGSAQVAQEVPYDQVPTLKSTPGVKVLIGPLWGASYITYNRNKAPYNELNVRKALQYATPREEIIQTVYKGIGKVPNALGGELEYWNPNSPTFTYNIAKAKELLKHSSVPNGFNMTINASSGESQGELVASILQSSYAKIGVYVTIQAQPISTIASEALESGKFDFIIWPPEGGYSNWYTPDAIYKFMISNEYKQPYLLPHASAKIISKLQIARESNSPAEREKLFGEIEYQTYFEEALFIPGVTLVTINLVSESVRGFQAIPNLSVRWNEVWLNNA